MIPKGIVELPNGQRVLENDSHISRWAEQHGNIITDKPLMNWLKPYLDKHGVTKVFDLGACIGDTTRQYLDWGYEVVAVEPSPLSYSCLSHNCKGATCLNVAVSDTNEGVLRFLRLDNAGASRIHPEGDTIVIPVLGDSLTEQFGAPQFIKADLEGHELNALRGLERTIEEHRPLVLCEINKGALADNGLKPSDVINWMTARGYSADVVYPPSAKFEDEQFDILFQP